MVHIFLNQGIPNDTPDARPLGWETLDSPTGTPLHGALATKAADKLAAKALQRALDSFTFGALEWSNDYETGAIGC